MKIRTRFAPSPTGYMHIGGVRTAFFAWLVARQSDGEFILRIEDTDRERHVEGAEQHIIDSLRWLGIESDQSVVRQSDRLDIYKEWAQKLVDSGRAYADPYAQKELEQFRAQAKANKKPFLFRDFRPSDPPKWDGSQPLRFKSEPKAYQWEDAVLGNLEAGPESVDDFIIIKSDGFPTYNFAHIIDDHLMKITHVVRSQEFLPSVPKFLNLYEALGIEAPILATLPYVMGPDGNKKLSKRDGAKDILDYKKEGYLPEAMLNFLASLGWNDGTEQEIFSREELIKKFELGRVQHGGARFDEKRLLWMNGQHIARLTDEELLARIMNEGFWDAKHNAEDSYRLKVIGLIKQRIHTLADVNFLSSMFFDEPDPKTVAELMSGIDLGNKTKGEMLASVAQELSESSFAEADIKNQLNNQLEKLNTKPAILFALIRIAVSGQPYSPELFGSLAVLGKEKTLARLDSAISALL